MIFEFLRERKTQRQGEPLQEQAVHKLVESQFGQCMLSLKAVKTQRNHHAKIGLPEYGFNLDKREDESPDRFEFTISGLF
jgi:hypothetical protein